MPGLPGILSARLRWLYLFLLNKWYFDELYDFLFVRASKFIGRGLWKSGDGAIIDGIGPDGIANTVLAMARRVTHDIGNGATPGVAKGGRKAVRFLEEGIIHV